MPSPANDVSREIHRLPSIGSKATPRPLLVAGMFGPVGTHVGPTEYGSKVYVWSMEFEKFASYPQSRGLSLPLAGGSATASQAAAGSAHPEGRAEWRGSRHRWPGF